MAQPKIQNQTIGLYFGSFNPPHVGHTIIAQQVLGALGLDEVWMVVSPHNPFKEKAGLLDEVARLDLVKRATEEIPGLSASDVEFELERPSYTIDTLNHLKTLHPEMDFQLIMGSDNILGIDGWKGYEELLADHRIAVYPRPGQEVSDEIKATLPDTVVFVDAPRLELSSTEVRRRIAEGDGWEAMVREEVANKIHAEGFYFE